MGRLHPASVSRKACGQGNAIHLQPPPNKTAALQSFAARLRLSKKWLAPLFRGVHSSLAPTARPGSYARKPLLRKAFCGFDAHPPGGLLLSLRDNSPCVAKSDQSLRGLRPPNPQGFFDRLGRAAKLCSAALWVTWIQAYAGRAESTYMTMNSTEMMYMNTGTSLPLPRISLIRE